MIDNVNELRKRIETIIRNEEIGLLRDFKNEVLYKMRNPVYLGLKPETIVETTFAEFRGYIESEA